MANGRKRFRWISRVAGPLALIAAAVAPTSGQAGQVAPGQVVPALSPELSAAAKAAANSYRISAGDELDVFVWGEDRMQRAVRVMPDGTVAFPLAGRITAVGRTVDDVSADIRERISVNYRSAPPDVTVTVRDVTGMRFFVIGKVRTPGSYMSGRAVDIVQALSMAGGLADFADVKNAVILRQTADGQLVERAKLDRVLKGARKLSPGALADPLQVMRSGDVLVVP